LIYPVRHDERESAEISHARHFRHSIDSLIPNVKKPAAGILAVAVFPSIKPD
jgi:hypothetical protein